MIDSNESINRNTRNDTIDEVLTCATKLTIGVHPLGVLAS